jgi:hypothetical protein
MMVLCGARFGRLLERDERVIPESIEVRPERIDALRIQLVDAAIANRPIDNELSVLEHPEVLRNRRTADGEIASERANWQRAFEQALEDRAAGWVA